MAHQITSTSETDVSAPSQESGYGTMAVTTARDDSMPTPIQQTSFEGKLFYPCLRFNVALRTLFIYNKMKSIEINRL